MRRRDILLLSFRSKFRIFMVIKFLNQIAKFSEILCKFVHKNITFRWDLVKSLAICGARRCERGGKSGCVSGCVNGKKLDEMKDVSWSLIESAENYIIPRTGSTAFMDDLETSVDVKVCNSVQDFKQKVCSYCTLAMFYLFFEFAVVWTSKI